MISKIVLVVAAFLLLKAGSIVVFAAECAFEGEAIGIGVHARGIAIVEKRRVSDYC